ncbi:hypothetical protein [Helicobacter pylori]|uniref:hypothetical protein n=1 Tax=Helicobacter pylori TaxID=210 RepID=UPI0018D0ECFE|nr:hypothetical protein [Helicobacter pylori]MBH0256618.1 hypothetical protein [Helicobacter pylori]MBH0293739.1 hypothetical protein [Helicobacter pylori]MBH0299610.1 hypothetical protein [Helicobacter pylori]
MYEKVIFVFVACSQENAIRVFGVMNTRGLDLSPTDIIKADLMFRLGDEDRDGFKKKWDNIQKDLDQKNFKQPLSII